MITISSLKHTKIGAGWEYIKASDKPYICGYFLFVEKISLINGLSECRIKIMPQPEIPIGSKFPTYVSHYMTEVYLASISVEGFADTLGEAILTCQTTKELLKNSADYINGFL